MTDTIYNEFQDPTQQFLTEPRAFCYDLATQLISAAKDEAADNWYDHIKTTKAILLLLFTWNFAARETKKLKIEDVGNLIRKSRDQLKFLGQFSIESVDDSAWAVIETVFSSFKTLLGQTGASKALSLLNPQLFVMWDTAIRKRLKKELIPGIGNGEIPGNYVTFLKGVQRIIKEYRIPEKLPQGSIIAKKIDEYHYVRIIMQKNTAQQFIPDRRRGSGST